MARKIAELYWRVITKGIEYAEIGVKKYEEQITKSKQRSIERLAKELNLKVIDSV